MTDNLDDLLARAGRHLARARPADEALVCDLAEALRACDRDLATARAVHDGPWPKFCPICMAEFHEDGTVTPSELTSVASPPTATEGP